MDDMENFINQKFTNAHYISQFLLPVAPSPTYPGSEWAFQMTNDGCVTAQSSNTLLIPGRQIVTYSAFQLLAESKSKHQARRHLPGVQGRFEMGDSGSVSSVR